MWIHQTTQGARGQRRRTRLVGPTRHACQGAGVLFLMALHISIKLLTSFDISVYHHVIFFKIVETWVWKPQRAPSCASQFFALGVKLAPPAMPARVLGCCLAPPGLHFFMAEHITMWYCLK